MSLCLFPQAMPADKGMGIVAQTSTFRELREFLGIASAQHDVIGHQRNVQTTHDIVNRSPPLRVATSLEPAALNIILCCLHMSPPTRRSFVLLRALPPAERGD